MGSGEAVVFPQLLDQFAGRLTLTLPLSDLVLRAWHAAEAAGARTQLAGVVGAAAIVVLLVAAPGLLADLPRAALAAVVIAASFSFADLPAMATLWRQRRSEFVLALVAFVGVAFIGVGTLAMRIKRQI
ncbi:MAG: hypothetical protein JNL98_44790 [Bryobacterales bacterium]|nr:hypothetical protein [Bryobacterales bacterium]